MVQPPPIVERSGFTCIGCGYDLSGTAVGGKCPECGQPVVASIRDPAIGPRRSTQATTSMILGIVGLTLFPLCGLLAWYMANKARAEIRSGGFDSASQTMATVGYVLGIIGTILCALWVPFVLLSFLWDGW